MCGFPLIKILSTMLQSSWFINFSAGFTATLLGFIISISYYRATERSAQKKKFLLMLRILNNEIYNNLTVIYPQIVESINNHTWVLVRFSNQNYQLFLQDSSVHQFAGISLVANTTIYFAEIDRINRLLDLYNPKDIRELDATHAKLLREIEEIRKQLNFHQNICKAYFEKKIDWRKKSAPDFDREYYERIVQETKDLPAHYIKP